MKCNICKTNIDHKPSTAKICGEPDCIRERNRLKARKHGSLKLWGKIGTCVVCDKMFNKSAFKYSICSEPCRKLRVLGYSNLAIAATQAPLNKKKPRKK